MTQDPRKWCHVCEQFRRAPLACGPTCMETDVVSDD